MTVSENQEFGRFGDLTSSVEDLEVEFLEYVDHEITGEKSYKVHEKIVNGQRLFNRDAPLIANCIFNTDPKLSLYQNPVHFDRALSFLETHPSPQVARVLYRGWLNVMPDKANSPDLLERSKNLISQYFFRKESLALLEDHAAENLIAEFNGGSFAQFVSRHGTYCLSQHSAFVQKMLSEVKGRVQGILAAEIAQSDMTGALLCLSSMLFSPSNQERNSQVTAEIFQESIHFLSTTESVITSRDLAVFKDIHGQIQSRFDQYPTNEKQVEDLIKDWEKRAQLGDTIRATLPLLGADSRLQLNRIHNFILRILSVKKLSGSVLFVACRETTRDRLLRFANYGRADHFIHIRSNVNPGDILILRYSTNWSLLFSLEMREIYLVDNRDVFDHHGNLLWDWVQIKAIKRVSMYAQDLGNEIISWINPTTPPKKVIPVKQATTNTTSESHSVPDEKGLKKTTAKDGLLRTLEMGKTSAVDKDKTIDEMIKRIQPVGSPVGNSKGTEIPGAMGEEIKPGRGQLQNSDWTNIDASTPKKEIHMEQNQNPFSPNGTIGRGAYALTMIIYLFPLLFLNTALEISADGMFGMIILLAAVLFMFLPFFATIKRLRDIGKNPWMSCLLLVPLVALVFVIWLFFAKPSQSSDSL